MDMSFYITVSDAPPEEVKERKYERFDPTTYKTDAEKRDELVRLVIVDQKNLVALWYSSSSIYCLQ